MMERCNDGFILQKNILKINREFNPHNFADSHRTPVVLEGAAFLPDLIGQCPVKSSNVVYRVPTMEFQLHHYRQRPWIQGILNECRNPHQAFDHWMKRDVLFGQEVIRQANGHGFHVIIVDGSVDIDIQFEGIEKQFRLGDA